MRKNTKGNVKSFVEVVRLKTMLEFDYVGAYLALVSVAMNRDISDNQVWLQGNDRNSGTAQSLQPDKLWDLDRDAVETTYL